MSELEQKAWDKGYACGKLDAADRIETLEADNQRLQSCIDEREEALRTIANPWANQLPRIEALEARLDRAVTRGLEQVERIATLKALRDVICDIDEYERVNNLAPSPGKTECWQSVANARVALAPEQKK